MKIARITVIIAVFFISFLNFSYAAAPSQGCFVFYGDTRSDNPLHEKIADAIIKIKPRAVFHTGDFVDDGSKAKSWVVPLKIISKIKEGSEFFPARGNHDLGGKLFFQNFGLPENKAWYSIEREGIHFVILDTNSKIDVGSPQYFWLENDLRQAARKDEFIITIFHHPIFSTGYHGEDSLGLKPILVPLFERYGVNIVFSGHDHDYERSVYNNIYYIVTGGGGAPLYAQKGKSPYSQFFIKGYHFCQLCKKDNQLIITVFDPYYNILDKFTVVKNYQ